MTDRPQAVPGLTLIRLVLLGAAFALAGAGLVHLDAAGDHTEHAFIAAFFVGAGIAQLLLAAAVAAPVPHRLAVPAAVAVSIGLLVTWVLSRTVGLDAVPLLGLVPGATGPEPLGLKDLAAVALELATLLLLGLAAAVPAAAGAMVLAPVAAQRAVAGLLAGTLALAVPGVLASHADDHGDHGHDQAAHGNDHDDGARAHRPGDGHRHRDGNRHGSADGDRHGHSDHRHGNRADRDHVHSEVIASDGHEHGDHAHDGTAHDGAGHDGAGHDGTAGHHHSATTPDEGDPLAGRGRITTVRVGPFPIPPATDPVKLPHLSPFFPAVAPGKLNLLPLLGIRPPCKNCYVLGGQPDLVYADGRPANLDTGPMLHHAVVTDPSRDDAICNNKVPGLLGERIFAVGNERTGVAMPDGYGMPMGSNMLGGAMELMNMSRQLRIVYFQLTVRWVPLDTPGIKPVRPLWFDIDGCGDSEVDIDAGVTDLRWDWTSSVTGRIVAAGGHLHDGGEWLSLHNASTREHVCTSVAGYGDDPRAEGSLDSMSPCSWDSLGSVREGQRLRLNAHYNTASPQRGVMGIMLGFLYETRDLDGGRPSPYPSQPPADGDPPDAGHHH